MDVAFYAALRGKRFLSDVAAAEDFVRYGMRLCLSPHPLLDFISLPPRIRQAWRRGNVRMVLAHLTGAEGDVVPVGPLAGAGPEARGPLLELARRLGREGGDGAPAENRVDWRVAQTSARRQGVVSLVMLAGEVRRTVRAVESLLQRSVDGEGEVEVVVIDHGSDPHVALGLHARLHGRHGVELVRHPQSVSRSHAMNRAVASCSGGTLLLLAPHVVVRRGALEGMLDALRDPDVAGVQPLLLGPDDTIDAAGLVVRAPGHPPTALLRGHPKEDARRLFKEPLVAISGEALALRVDDVVALQGLRARATWDEETLDLCAGLLQRYPAGFRLAATSLVSSSRGGDPVALSPHPGLPASPGILDRIGFVTTDLREPGPGHGSIAVVGGRHRKAPDERRWSLKMCSSPGRPGDLWGDTHFADALADALRHLGQDVVTSRRGAHTAGPTHLDDVSLALRGLYPIPPAPGQVNVLWVISHPDDVDPRELDGYDLVCAASTTWSAELAARTGRDVVPLLQATGFRLPSISATERRREPGAVFVGNANGRERPLVQAAVAAGVPVTVYGRGWGALPGEVWRGGYVDYRRLPELYHRHGIVLADHWPDMARQGFISNRVFDAIASGARVICDDVVGVNDVFHPRDVMVARTPDEVLEAFEYFSRVAADTDVPRPSLSFRDRARELLALVSGQ